MTAKKETPKAKATEEKPKVVEPANKEAKQTEDVLKPEEDVAVQNAKVEPKEFPIMDDSKESKDALKEHKDLVDNVKEGKIKVVSNNTPETIESIKKPLVPHEITGKPVHEFAEDFYKEQALKEDL